MALESPAPAVLAFDADRAFALFGRARIVDGEDAGPHRDQRPQPRPHRFGFPRRVGDEVLQRLVAGRIDSERKSMQACASGKPLVADSETLQGATKRTSI